MRVKLVRPVEAYPAGAVVEAESVELDHVRIKDTNIFLHLDEVNLCFFCDSCDYNTASAMEASAHELDHLGHFCDCDGE